MSLAKLALCLMALGLVRADEEVTLDIPQGTLKGLKTATIVEGKPMYGFKGIPYAKPNVGPDKFRDPIAAEPWSGVLDATQHRATCVFYCMLRANIFGEEDCLFLNVYTPEVSKDAKKAVMVWFHPGGFNSGAGDVDLFGPDFLIEKDVVLVTVNSRLGALGYLNTGDANAPGNAGLKDQVMALKWVRDNIVNFGGCKNRVTIFGQSSGGASVEYHMLSPMSQGLFKSAIAQSGSIVNPWGYSYMPKDAAFMLGEMLGIKTTDTTELVNKLKTFTAKELVDASSEMAKHGNHLNGFMHVFVPSAEANVGQEIFLPADPWEMLKSSKIADVPFMTGVLQDEGTFFMPGLIMTDPKMVDDHFENFLPNDLNITDGAKRMEIGESIKKFYFDGKSVANEPDKATELLGDLFFTAGTEMASKIINSRTNSPVYKYQMKLYDPKGFMKNLFGMQNGVAHGDDLGYLFYSNAFKNQPVPGTPVEQGIQMMTRFWTNFAKDGDPSMNMDGSLKDVWQPMGDANNYLELDVEPVLKQNLWKDRMDFWTNIYKDILGDYVKLFA